MSDYTITPENENSPFSDLLSNPENESESTLQSLPPSEADEKITAYVNSMWLKTTLINLDFQKITIVPDLMRFTYITSLFVSNNKLTSLPELSLIHI